MNSLSAAERATYFELFQMLMNQSLKLGQDAVKVAIPGQRDRTKRMRDMAIVSKTPEEALLICCSTSAPDVNVVQTISNPSQTFFGGLYAEKEKHFQTVFKKLMDELKAVFVYVKLNGNDGPLVNPHFHAFLRHLQKNRFGDEAAKEVLDGAIGFAEMTAIGATSSTGNNGEDVNDLKKRKKYMKRKAAALEGLLHAFTEEARALRFFSSIKNFVDNNRFPHCSGCGRQLTKADESLILGLCGHSSCVVCFYSKRSKRAVQDECVSEDCGLSAPTHTAIRFSDFDRNASSSSQSWGSKIAVLLELLRNPTEIAPEDFVVIFVQFDRIKAALADALNHNRIQYSDGSVDGAIEEFKDGKGGKVCVLNLNSVEAAGW